MKSILNIIIQLRIKVLIGALLIYFSCCQPPETQLKEITKSIDMKTPESIETEHTELHHQLEMATKLPGETGIHARNVAHLMHPHFKKEEMFALPPLTLLPQLSKGAVTDDMRQYNKNLIY